MKKLFFTLVAVVTLNQSLTAQTGKLIYTELGGPGLLLSANFDSRFNPNERLGFGFRLGAGFEVDEFYNIESHVRRLLQGDNHKKQTFYSFPVGLNYVFGKHNSSSTFEVGAGLTFLTRREQHYYDMGRAIWHTSFIYRIMPVNGGFSFRVGLTPLISGIFFPMGAIGFGYVF